ncbi:MAG: hypothetical protein ATN34_02060 [Epulopiscium sp. Nele67-Bin002]|nr:MAG: hypothetical protein ATN33_01865 [Epulopiscium sp. Nele67-Bin001]OON91765.1 MAG: hypothetical protein ATN34_02060 [Epulopiscium sp. Nele67-Bin002]
MCTALTLKTTQNDHLFGRTLDLEYNFGQQILFIPRNFRYNNAHLVAQPNYAILGTGTMYNDFPLLADCMNEKGLACAGLNFPKYGSYPTAKQDGKNNIEVFNFPMWLLGNFTSVADVRPILENTVILDVQVTPNMPNSPLHWIITDKSGDTIVVEQTADGLKIFDNPYGVLTNSPQFNWHTTNLLDYINLSFNQVQSLDASILNLEAITQGTGMKGLPGDYTSQSRFVRAVFLKAGVMKNLTNIDVADFFQILAGVSMPKGAVVTTAGDIDYTQYISCMNLDKGIYYYETYLNPAVYSIDMNKEDLASTNIKTFAFHDVFNSIALN